MNARQKAKHFKRLYEQSLPQKPYPIVYQKPSSHMKISYSIRRKDFEYAQDNPTLTKTTIENG